MPSNRPITNPTMAKITRMGMIAITVDTRDGNRSVTSSMISVTALRSIAEAVDTKNPETVVIPMSALTFQALTGFLVSRVFVMMITSVSSQGWPQTVQG